MDDLMPQDERQLLLRILAHGQHDAGRPVIQADGQRRRDRVGAHELPLAFPDPRTFQLDLPDMQRLPVRDRNGVF